MKPLNKQLEIIRFCKDIISTWEDTNDLASPTHFSDLMDFINTELDCYPDRIKEAIYQNLSELLNIIRKL